ncbi:hypothetical protein CTI12_AA467070 [Artemisia annua]|uniref:Uncharacterized protein n=1 Tax=Artemisia annua TaxID=35608 RepID=A0A2U1LPT8_ARTAN|nr:hypothetical protein CTI12_AA467070 [Artemisia annua]
MPSDADQVAKIGSMAFMCTMMANLLPSLATMDSKELLTNIIALDILVITLIVNVCIQTYTGLTILKSKQKIELKYQAAHENSLKDPELQQPGRLTVEKLKQHVKNHWIMAGTGSPQFNTACSATTSASGWFKAKFSDSSIVLGQYHEQQENFNDLRPYVLQLQDDMELSERTLKSISKYVNDLIKKAEKQQPNNLVELLRESKGFEGVGKYDSLHVPPLFAQDYLDCWSLPLVTLTAIAVSLPEIQNGRVDRLLSSVSEGLKYVTLVEESLNATDEYVRIQKAAKVLWLEVEVSNKWVGDNLKNHAPEVNTAGLILQWFKNTAKNMVTEVQVIDFGSANDNSMYRSICANSMYRITESILLSYHTNIDELSQEDLFTELSSMIADILAACLTNLPQVIVTKCHESVIEKRESSVNATVQLLGETMQIIDNLQDRELPDLDPAELPFIGKWRDYFNHPLP